MNEDIIGYVCNFLVECNSCDNLDIIKDKCCICSRSYCDRCKKTNPEFVFLIIYGFTESVYCHTCYNTFIT